MTKSRAYEYACIDLCIRQMLINRVGDSILDWLEKEDMELLSPAGNYKGLIGCVNAGADAVYLGGSHYGARAYADNFTDDEIIRAISYAHLNNVKVYLTVNTLIKEKEFSDVINYIRKFYDAGLDACIVQDLGLINVFTEEFPGLELHVSTQGFSHGINSVSLYKELGASRVVLARELSLEEIKNIKKKSDVELETFIHGSLCYAYSGECLFSSCLGGRSGNRGRCAGPCRLSYSVSDKEEYLLSMKDQCTVSVLPKLIDAGIDSLKIEGRMKSPEYTAFVTAIYRKYIDLYKNNPDKYRIDEEDYKRLKSVYLRSEISEGYYFKKNGKDMITVDKPSYLSADDGLFQNIKQSFLDKEKKYSVSAFVNIQAGEPAYITVYDDYGNSVITYGDVVLKAVNRPIDKDTVIKQINKTGDSFFEFKDLSVEVDKESFMPVSALNDLRRKALADFEDSINRSSENRIVQYHNILKKRANQYFKKDTIVYISSKEQYKALLNINYKGYIAVDYEIFESVKINNCILNLPYILRDSYSDFANKIMTLVSGNEFEAVIVNNYEEFSLLNRAHYKGVIIAGPGLYVFNRKSAEVIYSLADSFIYPLELSKYELQDLAINNEYLWVYGKIPLMHSANCIVNTTTGCKKGQGNSFSYIKDRKGMNIPVKRNCNLCYNTLFNSVPTCLFTENYSDHYRSFLYFTDESFDETIRVMNDYFNNSNSLSSFTKAYYTKGVE